MKCIDEKKDRILELPSPVKIVSSAILIDQDNRILITKRPEGKFLAGMWEFPGGKVKNMEAPEKALTRELKEELAINVSSGCLLPFNFASHRYEEFHLLMCVYTCRNWQGDISAQEGQEVKWVKANQLKDYDMPEANSLLISAIRDHFL